MPHPPAVVDGAVSCAAMDLHCRISTVGALPTLQVDGELDLASLPEFQAALHRLLGDAPGAIVAVDVDGLSVLDDTGLGVLLGAAGRARQHGGDLVVVCSTPRLLERFELSGLARAVEVRQRLAP